MKIKPDYKKGHTCYYCEKNKAAEECEYEQSWYGIISTGIVTLSVKYIDVKVIIPRCNRCKRVHFWCSLPLLIVFITSFIYACISIYKTNSGADVWYEWGIMLLLSFVLASLVSLIIGVPIRWALSFCFKGIKDIENTQLYHPVMRLNRLGFKSSKPDPTMARSERKIQEERYIKVLNEIAVEDKCLIEK